MSGPRPTPTSVLKLRGSWRADARPDEPMPEPAAPPPPRWVSKHARKHWRDIAEMLADLGIMTNCDRVALALLIDALGLYLAAKAEVEKLGLLSASERGATMINPAVRLQNAAWDRVLRACQEFGMTPASRTSVRVNAETKTEDKLEAVRKIG